MKITKISNNNLKHFLEEKLFKDFNEANKSLVFTNITKKMNIFKIYKYQVHTQIQQ